MCSACASDEAPNSARQSGLLSTFAFGLCCMSVFVAVLHSCVVRLCFLAAGLERLLGSVAIAWRCVV